MTSLDLYFFSGTGNTLLVAEKLAETFLKNKIDMNTYKIENSDPKKIDPKKTIGLAFPVAMQSTYPFIWNFINNLPNVDGTEIFMVDTLHAFSGAIVAPLKKVLKKKGYKTIGAKEIIMPSNLRKKINPKEDKIKIAQGLKTAEEYAYSLINKRAEWKSVPLLPHIFHYLVTRKYLWNYMKELGKKFKTDRGKCTKCKICMEICPVKNIIIPDFPEHQKKCELCMRCIMFCPTGAITMPIFKIQKYKAVDVKKIKNN